MIARITKTIIWKLPEEKEYFFNYTKENPEVKITCTTEETITTRQIIHICEEKK